MNINRAQIWQMWTECKLDLTKLHDIGFAADMIVRNWSRYKLVGDTLQIPAYIIGSIHCMEADFDFRTHLANGDPLWNSDGNAIPTSNVPKGMGPFKTWEEGAIAALKHDGLDSVHKWDLVTSLIRLEMYNGLGYRKHNINSPYIWSGTDQYLKGKYIEDGQFDPDALDDQIGCASILKTLKAQGVDLNEIPE